MAGRELAADRLRRRIVVVDQPEELRRGQLAEVGREHRGEPRIAGEDRLGDGDARAGGACD